MTNQKVKSSYTALFIALAVFILPFKICVLDVSASTNVTIDDINSNLNTSDTLSTNYYNGNTYNATTGQLTNLQTSPTNAPWYFTSETVIDTFKFKIKNFSSSSIHLKPEIFHSGAMYACNESDGVDPAPFFEIPANFDGFYTFDCFQMTGNTLPNVPVPASTDFGIFLTGYTDVVDNLKIYGANSCSGDWCFYHYGNGIDPTLKQAYVQINFINPPIVAIEAFDDLDNEIIDSAVVSQSLTDEVILSSLATHADGIQEHTIKFTNDDWATTMHKECGATGVCSTDICDWISCPLPEETVIKYKVYAKSATSDQEITSDIKDFSISFWVGFPDNQTGSYIRLMRPTEYLGQNDEPTFIVYPSAEFNVVFYVGHQGNDYLKFVEYTDSTFDTVATMSATVSTTYLSDLSALANFVIPISDGASKYFALSNHETETSDALAFVLFTITGDVTSEIKTTATLPINANYCDTIETSWIRSICKFIVPSATFFPEKFSQLNTAFNNTLPFVGQIKSSFSAGKIILDSAGSSAPSVDASSPWNGASIQLWDMSVIAPYTTTFRGYISLALWLLFITYVMRRTLFMFKKEE